VPLYSLLKGLGVSLSDFQGGFILHKDKIKSLAGIAIFLLMICVVFAGSTSAHTTTFSPSSRGWDDTSVTVTVTFTPTNFMMYFDGFQHLWSTSPDQPALSSWSATSMSNPRTLTQGAQGTWWLHMRVRSGIHGGGETWAWRRSPGTYRIDLTDPTISADPSSRGASTAAVSVLLHAQDTGGSGFDDQRHAWSTSTATPTSGWTGWNGNTALWANISTVGTWHLHVQARDNAGNQRGTQFGTYIITAVCSVDTPDRPTGDNEEDVGDITSFTAAGSACINAHSVQYRFDWGDGNISSWGAASRSHTWNSVGTFSVRAQARCATHTDRVSGWSSAFTITITPPPCTVGTPTTPAGNTTTIVNTNTAFTTGGSTCSNSHSVQYRFDWGNGVFSAWGSSSQSYAWPAAGTFSVRAQARCATHTDRVSGWSAARVVTITPVLDITSINIDWISFGTPGTPPRTAEAGAEVRYSVVFSAPVTSATADAGTGATALTHRSGNAWEGIFRVPITAPAGQIYNLTVRATDGVGTVHTFSNRPFITVSGNVWGRVRFRYIQQETPGGIICPPGDI
jgi:hypothetical protein